MKFIIGVAVVLFCSAGASSFPVDEDWDVVELQDGVAVKDSKIINSADIAVAKAVYWEDEGYEFQKKGDIYNLKLKTIFKESGEPIYLIMTGQALVGGFGWYPGYRSGIAECEIHMIPGNEWDWSWDGRNAEAECEIIYDDID